MPSPKTQEDLQLLDEAGRDARARFAPAPKKSLVRFGARAGFRNDDGLSTKPAPGPKGAPMSQLQEEARQRRREREKETNRPTRGDRR